MAQGGRPIVLNHSFLKGGGGVYLQYVVHEPWHANTIEGVWLVFGRTLPGTVITVGSKSYAAQPKNGRCIFRVTQFYTDKPS